MTWRRYLAAYAECSDWLASRLRPWRWLVSVSRQAGDLRRNPPKESDAPL